MSSTTRRLALLALVAAGCGDYGVELHIAQTFNMGVPPLVTARSLEVTMGGAESASHIFFLDCSKSFSFFNEETMVIRPTVKSGTIVITVVARDDLNRPIAAGQTMPVELRANSMVEAHVELGNGFQPPHDLALPPPADITVHLGDMPTVVHDSATPPPKDMAVPDLFDPLADLAGADSAAGARASLDGSAQAAGTFDTVIEATAPGPQGNALRVYLAGCMGCGTSPYIKVMGDEYKLVFEAGVSTVAEVEAAIAALSPPDDRIRVRTPGTGARVLQSPRDDFGGFVALSGGF